MCMQNPTQKTIEMVDCCSVMNGDGEPTRLRTNQQKETHKTEKKNLNTLGPLAINKLKP